MIDPLHKFPSTPHIAWLSSQPVRGDKLLTPVESSEFLSHPIIVEEKVDGANLGISFKENGEIRFQNRGNWLTGKLTGQWSRLREWSSLHESTLRGFLPSGHVLFGEWCYAKHSVLYDRLPDWFLAFDVFDTSTKRFWSTARRNILLAEAGLNPVPPVARGQFSLQCLIALLDHPSAYSLEFREGLYLRRETDEWLIGRSKLVRPGFVQQIAEHWSKTSIRPNGLVSLRHS